MRCGRKKGEDEGGRVGVGEMGEATDYHMTADQGNANAQFNLGLCYENGDGVNVEYSRSSEVLSHGC